MRVDSGADAEGRAHAGSPCSPRPPGAPRSRPPRISGQRLDVAKFPIGFMSTRAGMKTGATHGRRCGSCGQTATHARGDACPCVHGRPGGRLDQGPVYTPATDIGPHRDVSLVSAMRWNAAPMRLFLSIDEAEGSDLHHVALVKFARLDVVVIHPHPVEGAVVGNRVAIACRLNNRVAARNRHIV